MILDAVAAILRVAPDITMLHVEGHTDDQGDPAHNRELSMERARQVVQQFTARGVAASRLTAHGFGADRPVAQGSSSRARAANRRIEFRVDLDSAGVAAPAADAPRGP